MPNAQSVDETALLLATVSVAAERVLTAALGGPVRLGEGQLFGGARRQTPTIRFAVLDAPGDAPRSVIAKCVRGYRQHFASTDADAMGAARRLSNEWAGLHFLEGAVRASGQPPLSPRCFGGDHAAGLVVFEDLGDGECLADLLQGNEPKRAETCLLAYAATLGRMHAATIGRGREYRSLRHALGFGSGSPSAGPTTREFVDTGWVNEETDWQKDIEEFRKGCAGVGVELPATFAGSVHEVTTALNRPGPFLAFTPRDSCPDNHRFIDGQVRLFDFEGSTFRHAFLDAAYARAPFPTCWCVNRLPETVVPRFEATYRTELVKGCPAAGDDTIFGQALVTACAFWTITTIAWSLPRVLDEDSNWGIATVRQRDLLRLETLAAATEQFGYLEPLGAVARQLRAKLGTLWPVEEMPFYAAFREGIC
jgi:hypothetical protein